MGWIALQVNGLCLQFLPAGVSEEHFFERLTEGMSDHLVAQMQIPQAWQSEEAGGSGKGPGRSGVVAPAKGGKGGKGEGGKGEAGKGEGGKGEDGKGEGGKGDGHAAEEEGPGKGAGGGKGEHAHDGGAGKGEGGKGTAEETPAAAAANAEEAPAGGSAEAWTSWHGGKGWQESYWCWM